MFVELVFFIELFERMPKKLTRRVDWNERNLSVFFTNLLERKRWIGQRCPKMKEIMSQFFFHYNHVVKHSMSETKFKQIKRALLE